MKVCRKQSTDANGRVVVSQVGQVIDTAGGLSFGHGLTSLQVCVKLGVDGAR